MHTHKDITFDKRADRYDDGFEGKICRRFYTNLLSVVKVEDGYNVLDVGCGTGVILSGLSDKASFNGFGIDVSKPMLTQAKQKCPEMTFQLGDCADIPFEDNSFDVVTACMAYHHFPSQEQFRKETLRVLKSGGTLYICDPKFPNHIKKAANGFFMFSNNNARFYNMNEMKIDFINTGFHRAEQKSDAYVQVLKVTKG